MAVCWTCGTKGKKKVRLLQEMASAAGVGACDVLCSEGEMVNSGIKYETVE